MCLFCVKLESEASLNNPVNDKGSFLYLYLCIKRGMDILSGYEKNETNHAHQAKLELVVD